MYKMHDPNPNVKNCELENYGYQTVKGKTISFQGPALEEIKLKDIPHASWSEKCHDLCEKIRQTASKDWVFDWLEELKEWKSVDEHASVEWQLLFLPDRSIEIVENIRNKLANLQTEMVRIWNIMLCIRRY